MALKNGTKNEANYKVKVERVHRFDNGAIALDMNINGVSIYGATYRTKKDNPDEGFISFPARKGSDGKWYSYCYAPINEQPLLSDIEDQIDKLLS